jgi:hypothetical protein
LGTVKALSDMEISYRCMGIVFKIYSSGQTSDRERQNVENRAKKLEFQNSPETVEQKNNLFFKE